MIAMGLMSGTSMDGVSAALGDFQGTHFKLLGYRTYPYSPSLRKKLNDPLRLSTAEVSQLNAEVGWAFGNAAARFLKEIRVSPRKVAVIGSHGQTVYHGPEDQPPNTLQIGEAACIVERTGIPVVSDFRPADVAAGGSGAPLIPYFDFFFYGNGPVRAFQNIGGIANVCVVGRGVEPIAFDNGPGMSLIDATVQRSTHRRLSFDAGGRMARAGRMSLKQVERLLQHPYFLKRPPKSTGKELFGESFLKKFGNPRPKDLLATLTFFTAASIHDSYARFVFPKAWPKEIIVNGGGARNPVLMGHLRALFAPIPVRSIETLGIPAQAKEPLAFAFFASRAIQGKINHLPETTGARGARVLGKITRR